MGGPYPDFSYENKTKRFFCGIEPNVVWDVLPVLSVIGSGNWRIIDSGSDSIYWRLDSSDKSHTLIERMIRPLTRAKKAAALQGI
ncbi:hypothetical protein ES703_122167 [subsurface metagenome]